MAYSIFRPVGYNPPQAPQQDQDPVRAFLSGIGAAGLNENGQPIGSTGGLISINNDQYGQLQRLMQPAPAVNRAGSMDRSQGAIGANPFATLNKTLGLNLGAPFEGSAMKQATDSLPAMTQVAGAMAGMGEQDMAARFAQRMQETGGMPIPGTPEFQARSRAAENIYNQMQGQPSAFMPTPQNPQKMAYMGDNPGPTGQQVLAAGGQELTGYGGTKISGQAGPNGNQFFLRQNPATAFMPPSRPAQPSQPAAPAQPSAMQQAAGQYQQAVASLTAPREPAAPSGYRANPDGSLAFIPGGPADPATQRPNLTQTQRNAEYTVQQGIIAGTIKPEDKEEAVAVFSQELMGRAPKMPTPERDQALGNAKYLQSLDALNALVDTSVKSGGDDFGPIANRAKRWVGSAFGTYKNARDIEQGYKEAGSTKAFGEGGKQLTETEKEMTFGQIGSPTDDDFPDRLALHRSRVANVATLQLERLKASPYRFTSDGQAAIAQLEKALAGATGGAESVGVNRKPAAGAQRPLKIMSIKRVN